MKIKGKFLVNILFLAYVGGISRGLQEPQFHRKHVIGGEPADIKDFPYQLSLEYEFFGSHHFCGAVVISEDWALTAAHCILLMQMSPFYIRGGTSYKNAGGEIYEVQEVTVHPLYSEKTWDYDIAVIRVSRPFEFTEVLQPVEMARTTPYPGTPAVLTGWGCLNVIGTETEQLQKITLGVKDHEACSEAYQEGGQRLSPRMLCAFPAERRRTGCHGDSGGPLVTLDYQLVGIVSWGDLANKTVFADVANLRNWITVMTKTT